MKKMMTVVLILALMVGVGMAKPLADYDRNLIDLLNDENIGIRASAAQLLGERKVDEAVQPLMSMLKTEKDYKARIVAAIALHKIGNADALPVLKKVAKHDANLTVRRVVTGLIQQFDKANLANM